MSAFSSNHRSTNYIFQVKASFLYKGLAVLAHIIALPVMINYLGQSTFGVWSTLLTLVSWIIFFDLGIGSGLRNKLACFLACHQLYRAKVYITSAYGLSALVAVVFFGVLWVLGEWISWRLIFNAGHLDESVLFNAVMITALFVLVNFCLGLVLPILHAIQKTSLVVFGQFQTNLMALIFIILLNHYTDASLVNLALMYGLALVLSSFSLTVWLWLNRPDLIPNVKPDIEACKSLIASGWQFFMIQMCVLVLFATDKIIISHLFDPVSVTPYEVVFRVFAVITLLQGIIINPLWSSFTDAYVRQDFSWIIQALRKQIVIFFIIASGSIFLALMVRPLVVLFIGSEIEVNKLLIITMNLMVVIGIWNNIFAQFLNGIGKIKLSVLVSSVSAIVNIPLSILIATEWLVGVEGVVLGTALSLLPMAILLPLQTYKILNHHATGIWAR